MSKRIKSTLYMEGKISRDISTRELVLERDPQGFLFSNGIYRTKILPKDLPEWFVHGYLYKRHGYISAKDVKHLLYIPNYTHDNHLHKYDALYISYGTEIVPDQSVMGFSTWYKDYDHIVDGNLIVKFVEAAEKFSNYDVCEIRQEIARKQAWYYERNPK